MMSKKKTSAGAEVFRRNAKGISSGCKADSSGLRYHKEKISAE